MDKATVGGVLIALGGILAGLLLEGGNLGQILQPTAAMIVFGGTLGAVLIQFPLPVVLGALRRLGHIFAAPAPTPWQPFGNWSNMRIMRAARESSLSINPWKTLTSRF